MIAARRAISDTERRFPVRIRIGVPPRGLGDRLDRIQTWLDANCGADGWAMAPAGLRGPLNDAIAIYFNDATLAAAFVARWCAGYRAESTDGVFQIREDEPTPLSLRYCVALDGSFASGAASRRKSDLNPFGKNGHRRAPATNSENRVGSPYSGETQGPDSEYASYNCDNCFTVLGSFARTFGCDHCVPNTLIRRTCASRCITI